MRGLLLGGLVCLVSTFASAQTPESPGPAGAEAAVRAYVEAFAAGELSRALALAHPDETEEFASLLGSLFGRERASESAPAFIADIIESTIGSEPVMADAFDSIESAILGSVVETDSLVHVVGRASFTLMGGAAGGVEVTTVRWDRDRWWISFGSELGSLRAAVGAQRDAVGAPDGG